MTHSSTTTAIRRCVSRLGFSTCAALLWILLIVAASPPALAQSVTLRVIAQDISIVSRGSTPSTDTHVKFHLDPPRPSMGTWAPADGGDIAVVILLWRAPPPARMFEPLAACIRFANLVQVDPVKFSLSLSASGLAESAIEFNANRVAKVTMPPEATLHCDVRK